MQRKTEVQEFMKVSDKSMLDVTQYSCSAISEPSQCKLRGQDLNNQKLPDCQYLLLHNNSSLFPSPHMLHNVTAAKP